MKYKIGEMTKLMLWLKSRSHLNFFEILAKDGLNLGDGNEGGAADG